MTTVGGYWAHYRESDGRGQSIKEHLENVSAIASQAAGKIGFSQLAAIAGILHDIGKYSKEFQCYLLSAAGRINPDDDDYVHAEGMRGKIDHSTSGSQYAWIHIRRKTPAWQLAKEILSLCIASHHSGLIDSLSPTGEDILSTRLQKADYKTHFEEVLRNLDPDIERQATALLNSEDLEKEVLGFLRRSTRLNPTAGSFHLGMLVRFLFSAMIDADRLDSANVSNPAGRSLRSQSRDQRWDELITRLEMHLGTFTLRSKVDHIRAEISSRCAKSSSRERGLNLLTVPTGGGKTLASLRFALLHAKQHQMDRVIYVIPYTSIIDQNAAVVRKILEDGSSRDQIVLEHHSNLTPENDTWQSKVLSENWNAPVVYTTAVQFMETLFGAGTRGARRMHQLANAIIIFDEIQTIPIRALHLFNNAINFLVSQCRASVLFCTATQPILDQVRQDRGAAILSPEPELMDNVPALFEDLQRVEALDSRKPEGWQDNEIADLAVRELGETGSVLVIANTKASAKAVYYKCKESLGSAAAASVFHLSTNMCPAHRMDTLKHIQRCLDPTSPAPVICVSTQLIEAGVDIDFGCVIRFLAGLDSIAQAAGRCNRNGLRQFQGKVFIVNPAVEKPPKEIRIAQEKAARVLDEFRQAPALFDGDLLGPKAMRLFFQYYFYDRAEEMVYPVSAEQAGCDSNLLSMLSTNDQAAQAYRRTHNQAPPPSLLRQSFQTAANAFKSIDAPTSGIIVPYGEEGKDLVARLGSAENFGTCHPLLRKAQRFSVNVYPDRMQKLIDGNCAHEILPGSGIFCLKSRHYSLEFGINVDIV